MALDIKYRIVEKYAVTAELTQPMHIGSAGGGMGEILVHPVDDIPFIQASGIAGVFRSYCRSFCPEGTADKFFGSIRKENGDSEDGDSAEPDLISADSDGSEDGSDEAMGAGSRLRISDGYFLDARKKVGLELRPRIEINPETGSVASSEIKGSGEISGHKFEMEYIGTGAKCHFTVYDMSSDPSVDEDGKSEGRRLMERIFSAMNSEDIQFGGQKSNGCGYMKVDIVKFRRFNLTDPDQMRQWICDDEAAEDGMETLKIKESDPCASAYRIIVSGKTENRLLVKAIAVADRDGNTPDAQNMKNRADEYIVPASSFKGAVRARAEKILKYLEKDAGLNVSDILINSFGSDLKRDNMSLGNLRFFDTIVKDVWDTNGKACNKSGSGASDHIAERSSINHKIRIDKFTGGVMNKALVSENTIGGEISFRVNILDMNSPDKTCALMLMVLRDLANGQFNLGSGYNTGKGFIKVSTIAVKSGQDEAVLDFENNCIKDEARLIRKCMDALRKKEAV